jgi:hypothetical protein
MTSSATQGALTRRSHGVGLSDGRNGIKKQENKKQSLQADAMVKGECSTGEKGQDIRRRSGEAAILNPGAWGNWGPPSPPQACAEVARRCALSLFQGPTEQLAPGQSAEEPRSRGIEGVARQIGISLTGGEPIQVHFAPKCCHVRCSALDVDYYRVDAPFNLDMPTSDDCTDNVTTAIPRNKKSQPRLFLPGGHLDQLDGSHSQLIQRRRSTVSTWPVWRVVGSNGKGLPFHPMVH